MTWHSAAACLGRGAELFFPARGARNLEAEALCARCPVRRDCRDHAKTHQEPYGTWGGVHEAERPESSSTLTYARKRRRRARQHPQPISTTRGLRQHLLDGHDIYTAGWLWAELSKRHAQDHQAGARHHHADDEEAAG